jgi:hypothetical protein
MQAHTVTRIATHAPSPLRTQSQARTWPALVGHIHDALFDAQHSRAGLQGHKPQLQILISGALLNPYSAAGQAAIARLQQQLAAQDVHIELNCTARGQPFVKCHVLLVHWQQAHFV